MEDKFWFVLDSVQLINETRGNKEQVHAFWQMNIDLIDDSLIEILPFIATEILEARVKVYEERVAISLAFLTFGILIHVFPLGNRKINIELAITCNQVCLTLATFTRDKYPIEWAQTQTNLGLAYLDRIEGDQKDNVELAIQTFRAALEVYTRHDFPREWARTQGSLGDVYLDRIEGDQKDNVELAIQAFRAALEAYTRHDFPREWAMTQSRLGLAYWNRIEGDQKDNVELAIQAHRAALEVHTRHDFPKEWAATQHGLGLAYLDRIEGDQKDNVELAIQAHRAALEVHTRHDFPKEWAATQYGLGLAYWNRIEGDQKDNVELAIQAHRAALEVHTRHDFPKEWAATQHGLGLAYWDRIEGDQKDNIELAIQAHRAALEVHTRHDFPKEWATTQHGLGFAYSMRIEGDQKDNIELAIQAHRAALEVHTRHDFPKEWAATQHSLGGAYWKRIEGERKDNIELAIQALQAALRVRTRHNSPREWAATQHGLGLAYSMRIEGDQKDNIELAIQAFRAALEVHQPALLPLDCSHTGRNLGNLAFKEGNWGLAIEGFEKAITAVEISRSWAMSDRRRQEILNESFGIYGKMVQSCINADRLDLALQTVERLRSKRLVDLMAAYNLHPQGEIPEQVRDILYRIANLQQQMDQLRMSATVDTPELVGAKRHERIAIPPKEQILALEAEKYALFDELSRYDAVSAQLVEINPLDILQIQTDLLDRPDVALLSFYTTTQDTHILIVRSDAIHCFTCQGQGLEQLQFWLGDEWIDPYIIKRSNWLRNMPEHLQQLAEKLELDRLVNEHLQNTRELILIPHFRLHLIPFAALPLNSNQGYLGDRFLLRYAPSCQVLKFCTDRNELPSLQQYGTVENATEDLPFAEIEGDAIARIFQVKDTDRLRGSQQATIEQYKDLLGRVNSVASCHHAQSRLDNPLESALILATGRRVTLGDLLSPAWRFADLNDVFLSCCETGMTTPQSLTDELLTLGTGFLCAGARSVISSLWAVNDLATALFSQLYHQYRFQGQDRIVALQKAQQDLRRMSGDQLKVRSEAEFIPILVSQQNQLEQFRKDACSQKQQAAHDSETYQKCDSEQRRYEELIDRITETIMELENLWKESLPFDHPFYWAPFTCQGLR
jgi:CHAT domain-containing protein